jgi:hypothetical protein
MGNKILYAELFGEYLISNKGSVYKKHTWKEIKTFLRKDGDSRYVFLTITENNKRVRKLFSVSKLLINNFSGEIELTI